MGVNKGGMEDYFNSNRQIKTIVLSDRDVMAFWNDRYSHEASSTNLEISDINDTVLGTCSKDLKGKNVLWCGRINGLNIATGAGPGILVTYKSGTNLFPFLNVYNYDFTFDKTSNVITMVFWCNMKDSWSGTTYDYNNVWEEFKKVATSPDVWDWEVQSGNSTTNLAKRHLFFATGSIRKAKVVGGMYGGGGSGGWSFIPVFENVKKIAIDNAYDYVPSYPVYPKVYQATTDEADGKIKVKAIKSDGTLVGSEIEVFVIQEPEA